MTRAARSSTLPAVAPYLPVTLWTIPEVRVFARRHHPFLATKVGAALAVVFVRVDHGPTEIRWSNEEIDLAECP